MFSFLHRFFPSSPVPDSIYDFRIPAIKGGIIDFSQFRGKKILIVNTASFCGHTPQYAELETLYQRYKDKLIIVGFPANNFMFQEPGSNNRIANFCETEYHITFPMATKISVKGFRMAPIYRWLTQQKYNGYTDSEVKWNFQKYLVSEEGKLTHIFSHKITPLDPSVIEAIER